MIGHEKRYDIEVDSIRGFPVNNNVLVEVDLAENQRSKSGLILGDKSWDESGMVTRTGTVVAIPGKLWFRKRREQWGMEWETDMLVEVGDRIFWGILSAYDCPVIMCKDKIYFLIKYDDVICRTVSTDTDYIKLYPLNGYVLYDILTSEEIKGNIHMIRNEVKNEGIVKAVGAPNKNYLGGVADAIDILPGDRITMSSKFVTPLEDKRFAVLPFRVGYVQRRWIVMVDRR